MVRGLKPALTVENGRIHTFLTLYIGDGMLISTKGQVTIPADIRRKAGLLPNTEVEFVIDDQQRVVLMPKAGGQARGERLVNRLRNLKSKLILSPEEIMRLTRGED